MKDDLEISLIKLFGSTSRARILLFLFKNPQQPSYQREIMFEAGLSLQTVQRELENLSSLGIIEKRKSRARVYYQVDESSCFFKPLKLICEIKK